MEELKFIFKKDIFELTNTIVGQYGDIVSRVGYIATQFISVLPGQKLVMTGYTGYGMCWYDNRKTFVSRENNDREYPTITITVPNNVYYFRTTFKISSLNEGNASIKINDMDNMLGNVNAHPLYNNDFSLEYELQNGQQFYRQKVSGKLTFCREDYEYIMSKPFDEKMLLTVLQRNKYGTFQWFFDSYFMRTDCTIDEDNKIISVTPTIIDEYNNVINGMEKEFDILKLGVKTNPLTITKRPLIQVYRRGDVVLSNFLSGMSWEQDVNDSGISANDLVNKYYFSKNITLIDIVATAKDGAPIAINGIYEGKITNVNVENEFTNGTGYKITYQKEVILHSYYSHWRMYDMNGKDVIYNAMIREDSLTQTNITLNQNGIYGGNVQLNVNIQEIFVRYLCDVEKIFDSTTNLIPSDDIVDNNKQYKRVIGYGIECVDVSTYFTNTPNEYGSYNGKYYLPPAPPSSGLTFYPILQSYWGNASYWFYFPPSEYIFEKNARKEFVLKDSYLLSDCIKTLLNQIDPYLKHEGTASYSQFLYGSTNPLTGSKFKVLLTQKTNIINGQYQTPATKAITTLKQFTDMLKNCFNCYWYIQNGMFKIEHVKFFENGMSYTAQKTTWKDLTTQINLKNNKPWAFASSNYTFEKINMPERYEYEWMDETTESFSGSPIEILSNYVEQGKIEKISIGGFTSDIDYMLLNPGEISKDGFCLFCAVSESGKYKLPFVDVQVGFKTFNLQNGYASMAYLQNKFLSYDLPARRIKINGLETLANSVSKNKKQTLTFPTYPDMVLQPLKIIKTFLGDGHVEKLTLNLSSRMVKANLKYKTE